MVLEGLALIVGAWFVLSVIASLAIGKFISGARALDRSRYRDAVPRSRQRLASRR